MKVDIGALSSDPIEKDLHGLCSRTIRLFYKDDADFKKNTYDLNIDVGADLGRVCLVKGVTYTDEMGNCTNRDVETVTGEQWIRKGFWIHQPKADSVQLVYLNNKPSNNSCLFVTVNEQETIIFKEVGGREYWDTCWIFNYVGIYLGRSAYPEILTLIWIHKCLIFRITLFKWRDSDWVSTSNYFNWKLRRGGNQLRVEAVNKFGWESKGNCLAIENH